MLRFIESVTTALLNDSMPFGTLMPLLGVSGVNTGPVMVLRIFVEIQCLLRKVLMVTSVIKAICQLLYENNIPLLV